MARMEVKRVNLKRWCDTYLALLCLIYVNLLQTNCYSGNKSTSRPLNELMQHSEPMIIQTLNSTIDFAPSLLNRLTKASQIEKGSSRRTQSRREVESAIESDDIGSSYDLTLPEDQSDSVFESERNPEESDGDYQPEPEGVESNRPGNLNQNDQAGNITERFNDDLERIVRSQVDQAATDWATLAPTNYQTNPFSTFRALGVSTVEPLLEEQEPQDNNQQSAGAKSYNQMVHEQTMRDSNMKMHPNHNYANDQNSSNPVNGWNPGLIETGVGYRSSTPDPMTASSDGSNKYGFVRYSTVPARVPTPKSTDYEHQHSHLRYQYRLRGPITSGSSTSSPSTAQVMTRTSTTVAPSIIRAFHRLDLLRSHKSSSPGPLFKSLANKIMSPMGSNSDHIDSLDRTSKISATGFMDVPESNNHPGEQINTSLTDTDLAQVITQAPGSRVNHEKSMFRKNPQSAVASSDEQKVYKLSQTQTADDSSKQQVAPARSSLPGPQGNLNGSLAARLSANRHKNRYTTAATGLFQTPAEPLTVNIKNLIHPDNHKFSLEPTASPSNIRETVSLTTPSAPTSSTAFLRPMQSKTVHLTTIRLPTTTFVTSAPNLAPALYAASLKNKANLTNAVRFSQPTHHHHLHAHVHSIKPAVISIPVPIKPKLNAAYDGWLTVAAAAAATANRPEIPLPQLTLPGVLSANVLARKIQPASLPIGAKLPLNNLHQKALAQESQLVSLNSYPSILGNILGTANKAFKQVAGNTISMLSMPTSNGAVGSPVHPSLGLINTDFLIKKALHNSSPHRHRDGSSLTDYFASGQEAESQEIPYESMAVYQPAIDELPPMDSYLASLLSSNTLNELPDSKVSLNLSDSLKQQQQQPQAQLSQQVFIPNHNMNPEANKSQQDTESVMLAPLGGTANLLYPIIYALPEVTGGANSGANSSNKMVEVTQFEPEHAAPSVDHEGTWDRPSQYQSTSDSHLFDRVRADPRFPTNDTKQKQALFGGGTPRPLSGSLKQLIDPSEQQMQYALAHYIENHQHHRPDQNRLVYDVYENKNKYSSPSFFSAGADGFRPISRPPVQYYFRPANGSKVYENQSNHEDRRLPVQHTVHSSQQGMGHGFEPYHERERFKKTPLGPKYTRRPSLQSAAEHNRQPQAQQMPQQATKSSPLSYAQPYAQPYQIVQLTPQHLYPSDIVHHALLHAGSSIQPHVSAANEILNYHRQHLLEHHYLHHHHHHPLSHLSDMATSESARLAVGAPARPLLLHFWPLALALLPIMIIVAIVAQLIMAAPLLMFAMATLTVSGFGGALANREEIGEKSEPQSSTPSQNFLPSSFWSAGNSTSAKRRKRSTSLFEPNQPVNFDLMEDYFERLWLKVY